jgi:hypothetical protein
MVCHPLLSDALTKKETGVSELNGWFNSGPEA